MESVNGVRTACGGKRLEGNLRQGSPGRPLISIVIAVLNGCEYVENSIQSVLEQTYPEVELIIVDGGSNDGTVEILRRYSDAIDYWISEPDGGIYDAWNKGVKLARGEWIGFLGSDDRYKPDAISKYVDFIAAAGCPFDFVSSRVSMLCPNGSTRLRGAAWNWQTFRSYMNVAHVGALHHRSLFERMGNFDTSYRVIADYELLLRARDTLRAGFLDAVTAEIRLGGISDSMRALEETLRAKVATAGRRLLAAKVEYYLACAKFLTRKTLGW